MRNRFVVGALGLTLLFGPWLAAIAGARSNPIASENRALAAKPEWRGFKTLEDITSYTADHFPLRDNAIRANKKLGNVAGSGGPTGPAGVGGGTGGAPTQPLITTQTIKGKVPPWVFLSEDFNRACVPGIPLEDAIAGLKRLNDIITKSGRRFVFTIAPDKSTFQTNFLPSSYPLQDCSTKAKAERRKRVAALKLPGFVDALPLLKKDEKATGKPAYLERDSHWTDRSGAVVVKALAEKLDPSLAAGTELQFSHVGKHANDLAVLEGDRNLYDDPVWEIMRDGVTATIQRQDFAPQDAYEIRTITATTTGTAKLFAPKTFWIGDSFSDHAVHQFSKYFADLVQMPDLTKAASIGRDQNGNDLYALSLPTFIAGIKNAKVIVFEAVERFFFGAKDGSLLNKEFLDQLETALKR